jgi:hypothetical protein
MGCFDLGRFLALGRTKERPLPDSDKAIAGFALHEASEDALGLRNLDFPLAPTFANTLIDPVRHNTR